MDGRERQRTVYVSARQKKKLINLMTKHPELVPCKITQRSNHGDLQKLWQNIANECNAIPGARKTWRQWRKTWQDLKSKYKTRNLRKQPLPASVIMLSQAEQEVLGIKHASSTSDYEAATEFIPIENENESNDNDFNNETASNASYSEPESLPEQKVFTSAMTKVEQVKSILESKSEHSNICGFNCDKLAALEQKKVQLKEDYFNFKKDYLQQKLLIMKEQSEALQSIAKELNK